MHRNSKRTIRRPNRSGAVFSVEMMMVISVLIPMMFALTEFSLLWSARHTLQAASFAAARAAAMPCATGTREMCGEAAAESVLVKPRFVDDYDAEFMIGPNTGDEVKVTLTLPMTSAAPDLLAIIGISVEGKVLTAETVTRRE